ncbi:tetratricopeptide repeat (TPR)-like superfamily protein [Artemisia annua]|uniref:Tetratricopeptide repeat (TPR)-like superfamily protein n=1 Tax=Artemisia annua TaxID=35608 RepID=A0A2U1L1I2_ARTAN|nr:tetratricopeptide repeat (TPR)-like superfamily protein [Artemisia annua]
MKNRGIEKSPGVSSIEINGIVYQFVAGDQSHVKSDHIYKMLDNLSHELMISGYLLEVNETLCEEMSTQLRNSEQGDTKRWRGECGAVVVVAENGEDKDVREEGAWN